jgi:uncharacterized membrane protein YhaH (DUF805 family)
MSMTQLLFSFQGRLNRKPYWMTVVAVTVASIIVLLFILVIIREHLEVVGLMILVFIILYIPLIWIVLALAAKRLHDRDKSAWWLLVFYAIPAILNIVGNRLENEGIILYLISFCITVWAFVELGCLRGTRGPNRFGPDPLSAPT